MLWNLYEKSLVFVVVNSNFDGKIKLTTVISKDMEKYYFLNLCEENYKE